MYSENSSDFCLLLTMPSFLECLHVRLVRALQLRLPTKTSQCVRKSKYLELRAFLRTSGASVQQSNEPMMAR